LLDSAAVILQGFHFHSSSNKPRLEMFCELGCCLEDIMPASQYACGSNSILASLHCCLQGFHFNGSSSKPRLEIFWELGCCLPTFCQPASQYA
jgi:hypothetical protein